MKVEINKKIDCIYCLDDYKQIKDKKVYGCRLFGLCLEKCKNYIRDD